MRWIAILGAGVVVAVIAFSPQDPGNAPETTDAPPGLATQHDVALLAARGRARPAPAESAEADALLVPKPEPVAEADQIAIRASVRAVARSGAWIQADRPAAPNRPTFPDPALGDPAFTPSVHVDAYLDALAEGRRDAERGAADPPRGIAWQQELGVLELVDDEPGAAEVDPDADGTNEPERADPVTAVVGTVTDPAGTPVPGADVVVYSAFYERHVAYGHRVREVGRAVTDMEGRFDLRPIRLDTVHFGRDGELLLTIRADGFGDRVLQRLQNIRAEIENDLGPFALAPETAGLEGTLTDRQGQPVEGAVVRVSGEVVPTLYDKVARMVFLEDCPSATSDADGRFHLDGFAPGRHHVTIHVNVDCVWNDRRALGAGTSRLDLRVRAGGSVRGRVLDGDGNPLADAVVYGGGNYTPTYADGTYWLDNIDPGPFALVVSHHRYRTKAVPQITAGTEDLDVVLTERLPRLVLLPRTAETGEPIALVSVDWIWKDPRHQSRFAPASPFHHDAEGRHEIVVPEGAVAAVVAAEKLTPTRLDLETIEDMQPIEVALEPHVDAAAARDGGPSPEDDVR